MDKIFEFFKNLPAEYNLEDSENPNFLIVTDEEMQGEPGSKDKHIRRYTIPGTIS